jgi:Tfp pilus assembly protein PilF
LKLDPNNVFVLNNYAYYLSLRKVKLDRAAQMAKLANELAPNQASFEDTYAWVLFQQGKYTDALQWIKKALEHGNSSGELLEHYGDILFKAGNLEDALEQWKKAKAKGGTTKTIDQKIDQGKYIE